jgi:hypothetical protein
VSQRWNRAGRSPRECARSAIQSAEAAKARTPMPPPFRQLARRLDLDLFSDRLREDLTVEHPDMPAFRFTWSDARALVLYLRSIQAP